MRTPSESGDGDGYFDDLEYPIELDDVPSQ